MKKVVSLILVLAFSLLLCACRDRASKESTAEESIIASTESAVAHDGNAAVASEDQMAFHEPVILLDNTTLQVAVTNFFQSESNLGDASGNDKYITLRFQSRTDRSLLIILDQLSIDDRGADVFRANPTVEIRPKGEVTQYFRIRLDESKPLNDMVDLFQLRGTMSIYLVKQDGSRDRLQDADFYIAEAFGREPGDSVAETSPAALSLGDTATTDMAEFTLTDFEICEAVKLDENSVWTRLGIDAPTPGSGMVYAAPAFTLRNTGKEIYGVEKALSFSVDYNDGYLYEMDDYRCYINHAEGTWERNKVGTSSGQRPELPPLMSGSYQVFIPAIDRIASDTESPLRLIVRLPDSSGSQEFVYRIR